MKQLIIFLTLNLLLIALAESPQTTPAADAIANIITEASQEGYLQVPAQAAAMQMQEVSPLILDVRTQTEWDELGYIENAELLPVTELSSSLDKLPPNLDEPIIVYCASGNRGNFALLYLKSLGYTNVQNLRGGYKAWLAEGYPYKR